MNKYKMITKSVHQSKEFQERVRWPIRADILLSSTYLILKCLGSQVVSEKVKGAIS